MKNSFSKIRHVFIILFSIILIICLSLTVFVIYCLKNQKGIINHGVEAWEVDMNYYTQYISDNKKYFIEYAQYERGMYDSSAEKTDINPSVNCRKCVFSKFDKVNSHDGYISFEKTTSSYTVVLYYLDDNYAFSNIVQYQIDNTHRTYLGDNLYLTMI